MTGRHVRLAEGFGPGPVGKGLLEFPDRVRGEQRVVFVARGPQQVELMKPGTSCR